MKKIYFFCLFISFNSIYASAIKYKVGVEETVFMPYSEVDSSGNYRGILRDIFDLFAAQANLDIEYVPLPIDRLYANFFDGKINFKLPANQYWKSVDKKQLKFDIIYSEPVVPYLDGLMIEAGSEKEKHEIKNIGIVSGFTPWGYEEDISEGTMQKYENPSIIGLLKQGILGRVNAIYINVWVAEYYLREKLNNENALVLAKNLPFIESAYHLATITHGDIIESFNKFLAESGDKIMKLREKYQIKTLK